MNKREFLKTTGALVAGSMLQHVAHSQPGPRTNWSGNLTYSTSNLQTPGTVDELRAAVKNAGKLRALGSRHSFNSIADSTHEQISLKRLTSMTLDEQARTVTVGGASPTRNWPPWLDAKGYALHNLASLPGITVAGACATGTHGSGLQNGNLATVVSAIEFVNAHGDRVELTRARDGDRFLGAVVGLGSIGVVTRTTLDVQPTYKVAQSVYQDLSFDALKHHLQEIFSSGYSVSVFTDWQHHRAEQLWVKRRLKEGDTNQWQPELFGAKLATEKLHPLPGHPTVAVTDQLGIPGPWHRPPSALSYRPNALQRPRTANPVPRALDHAWEAIEAVEKLHGQIGPHLFITELRTVAPDRLWMSMEYHRQSLAIHFTWKPEWPAVREILPLIEAQLRPFSPRPHWGKLFTMPASLLEPSYPRLPDFRALAAEYDPQGKFRNRFVQVNAYSV